MFFQCAICSKILNENQIEYYIPGGKNQNPVVFCCPEHSSVYNLDQKEIPLPPHLSREQPKPSNWQPRAWWDGEKEFPNPKYQGPAADPHE